jgi:CRISPR-associated protein (TIGR03986 family)
MTKIQNKKPYHFAPVPKTIKTEFPIWHDGSSQETLSGEIRFELETLTPLLVGWERRLIEEIEESQGFSFEKTTENEKQQFVKKATDGTSKEDVVKLPQIGLTIKKKPILCPLRAPWGKGAVILPGDSLKGLLRHEIGALLGAPMERVAERSYSYRPNSLFTKEPCPYLVPRLAIVPDGAVEIRTITDTPNSPVARVPTQLDLLPLSLKYDKTSSQNTNWYRFDVEGAARYRGGMGAGERLNSKKKLHHTVETSPKQYERATLREEVIKGHLNTITHLADISNGHFSERHPDIPEKIMNQKAREGILKAAKEAFQPGDIIWVEWDTEKNTVVSFGWHYYYRWAYTDTVRKKSWGEDRSELSPQKDELDGDTPKGLSAVRRLFGYTGDNDGCRGIGKGDHEQLMGRIFINSALEVVEEHDDENTRFLPFTFLKELGQPRPSAVENYLQRSDEQLEEKRRDQAILVTYGDAEGYDLAGDLAGRKFYVDRADAYNAAKPWKDDSDKNRSNERSTLALQASKSGRRFRFTLRFRDLEEKEIAAILLAFCPNQFAQYVGGNHKDGYCSKLGYARPLGWGSIRTEAKALFFLKATEEKKFELVQESSVEDWFQEYLKNLEDVFFHGTELLCTWLDLHRHKHPDAADYPRINGKIHTYHTNLRSEHTRKRRYRS